MRIGVNCFLLQAHIGGLKQYFINLFDWLLENDRDNSYIFFHFKHNLAELEKLRSSRWKQGAIQLENQNDIDHHLSVVDLYFCPFSALWPRPVPLPSVLTLVDIQEAFYPEFFTPADRLSRAWHYPGSTRAADCVVTISEYSKQTICERHGIAESKVVVAHLCADPIYFRAAEETAPPEGAPAFERYVFFPGNRWLHKNHDCLLRAMRILNQRDIRINAVFTGLDLSGGYPLSVKAREYGLSDQVETAGYVTLPQMAHLYRRAEMLVFPSLFEGFGMPAIEAMAAGCPAVVSNATSLPEICGEAAEYFDPNSPDDTARAIARVWGNARRREDLIAKGYEQARRYSPQRLGEQHLEAFRQAVRDFSLRRYYYQKLYQPYHRARVHTIKQLIGWIFPGQDRKQLCSIAFGRGWHFREQSGADWIRWSSGRGRFTIRTAQAFTLELTGQAASLARPNQVTVFVNGKKTGLWTITGDFGFRELPPLLVPIRRGRNTLELVSGNPPAAAENDGRMLSIAVKNLRFADVNTACAFEVEN